MEPRPDARPIDQEPALAALGERIAAAPYVALALELNATHAYRPRICLVQLDVGGELAAIDGLAFEKRRPSPIGEALQRRPATSPLLVHGGEYALHALARELKLPLAGVVDTQQAAVLLGIEATGLRSLCAALLGVTLPPPASIDWSLRPVPPGATAHALGDVAHLAALWAVLGARIAAADLADELALASVPPPPRSMAVPDTPDPRNFKALPGAARLPPEAQHMLAALVRWRDMKAKELDVPPGKLLTNALLVDIAHAPERAPDRLASMRFHSRLVHADLEALRRVVALALASGGGDGDGGDGDDGDTRPGSRAARRDPRPHAPGGGARPGEAGRPATPKKGAPTPAVKARLQRLKAWRRDEAAARGVGLPAILPLAALEHLAFFPTTPLGEVPQLGRRRIERYASVLAALLTP